MVTVPLTVIVPVVMLMMSFRPEVVALKVSEPAETLPALTFTVKLPEVGRGMLINPVTVKEFVPLMVKVVFEPAANVIVLH